MMDRTPPILRKGGGAVGFNGAVFCATVFMYCFICFHEIAYNKV